MEYTYDPDPEPADRESSTRENGERESVDHAAPAQVLPTMADLDRLADDLDRVDATLAALDRNVAGAIDGSDAAASAPSI